MARTTIAAVGLLALAACVVFVSVDRDQGWDVLEGRFAKVRAVGDEGCLGRDCQLSDTASRKDLDSWMDGFLNKGEHAGHRPRDARSRKGMKMGLAQMRDTEAVDDLNTFFDRLDSGKTHRVLAAEKREAPNPRLSDQADRQELRDFYDNITPKAEGRRAGVRKVAEAAEDLAAEHHKAGKVAQELELEKMNREHKANEAAAAQDHKRYQRESAKQVAMQDSGHDMQAVPTTRLAPADDRAHSNEYFSSLQGKSQRTVKREAGGGAGNRVGFLSADAAREQQDKFFSSLASQVHKTAKVLAAEARSEEEAKQLHASVRGDDQTSMARSNEFNKKTHEAVPKGRLSAREDRAQLSRWYSGLNKSVKKTKRVLASEKRAKTEQRALEHYVARADSSTAETREHWEKAQAVPAGRLSAAEYQREQARYFKQLDGQVKKTPRVLAAEKRARDESLRRKEALQEEGKASAEHSLNEEVAAARRLVGGGSKEYLTKKQAEQGLDKYYKSLDKRDHIMPAVKRAEEKAKLAALHLKENEYSEDEQDARAEAATREAVPHAKLSRRQALRQQQRYFKQLDKEVHKTPAVLIAEARAKAAKKSLLYSAEAARKQLAADIKTVTKASKTGSTLASHAMRQGELLASGAAKRRRGARGRRRAARHTNAQRLAGGKIDVRSFAHDAVYSAHAPDLSGKIKLEWKGKDPASDLYGRLKQQALSSKAAGGSMREATEEWDHRKNSLVDKMVDDFKHFKI